MSHLFTTSINPFFFLKSKFLSEKNYRDNQNVDTYRKFYRIQITESREIRQLTPLHEN